jgi:hypothetical protein
MNLNDKWTRWTIVASASARGILVTAIFLVIGPFVYFLVWGRFKERFEITPNAILLRRSTKRNNSTISEQKI